MWNIIVERLPGLSEWIYSILSFLIPFTIYKINKKIRADLDPPWKEEEQSNSNSKKQSTN